jgi:uncharacterized protein (DUF885 family)
MRALQATALAFLLLAGCARKPQQQDFGAFVSEFVLTTLADTPVSATTAGYHVHKGVRLDEQMNDLSPEGLRRTEELARSFRERLARFDKATLGPQDRADYELIDTQLARAELQRVSDTHDPASAVEAAGRAVFTPFSVEYAPLEERYGHIIARLEKMPRFFEQASKSLRDTTPIWTAVASEENEGTIALVNGPIRSQVPERLKAPYEAAAGAAIAAMRGYNAFLASLPSTGADGWRLGPEKYEKKFALVVAATVSPKQALADAEAELTAVRRRMFQLAVPLHHRLYPSHRDPVDLNLIVGEVLARIADRHATPETYLAAAQRTLEEARAFVAAKSFLTLPGQDNLRIIETPVFMRGIYGVGGFDSAPPLDPSRSAFYWVTPIGKDWPKARQESKLREYNNDGLRLLTLHEAIPGHYLQFEYASRIQPEGRRLLRSIFGNDPYVEGWAVYGTELMLDQGYLDDSVELRLSFLKQQLRTIANTILDIRLHTMAMTDEQAMELMLKQTFQEKEEATAKLRRAKLDSCQLPAYFTGYRQWILLRQELRRAKGGAFDLREFHRQALEAGALPFSELASLLGVAANVTAGTER